MNRSNDVSVTGIHARRHGARAWRRGLWVLLLAAMVPLPRAATAKEPDALEEIIVTARKREESLQVTPIAVSAFTSVEIEERSMTNLMDVGSLAPNVLTGTGSGGSGGGNNGQIYIRGIGQFDFLFTTDPGVGIYIDGVYHARALGAVMDLLDLERIEILRGPQGTLFGRNTIGGAINVISSAPAEEFGGYVEGTYGEFDRMDFRGSVDLPLVENQLYAKAAISYKNRDGTGKRLDFFTGDKTESMGDEDQLAARGAMKWIVTDAITADFIFDYTHEREKSVPNVLLQFDDAGAFGGVPTILWNALIGFPSGLPMSSAFIADDKDETFATGPNRNALDQWGINGTITWDLGFATLKSITAYREMEGEFGRDGDGSPLPIVATDNTQDQDQVSQEFQLAGTSFDEHLDWVVGLYYFDEYGRDQNDVRLASGLYDALEGIPVQLTGAPCAPPFLAPGCPGNPINPLLDLDFDIFNEIDITSLAAFAQATAHFTDRFSVTGGLRYTYESKEYFLEHRRVNSNTFIIPGTTVEASWNEPTPMFSVQYQWTDRLMTYFTYSEGFKSGGFNGRPTVAAAVDSYDPEFLANHEFGIKSEWFDRRLRLNAAAFMYDYDDLQFTAVSADPATGTLLLVVDNVGKADVRGVELELLARPVDALDINAAIGYTDFEITELDPSVTDVTLDTHMVNTPEWTASAGIQYTWPAGASGEVRVRGDWVYQDTSYIDILNTPALKRDAHSIFNARITWVLSSALMGGGWELAAFGTNLADERVLANGISALDSFGTVEGFYNRPREWGITVRKSF